MYPTNEQICQDIVTLLIRVEEAISKMKHGKTPENNGISTDLVKADGMLLAKLIHKIIVEIWDNEEVVEDWTSAILIRL